MSNYTNLNITKDTKQMKYILEMSDTYAYSISELKYHIDYEVSGDNSLENEISKITFLSNDLVDVRQNKNYWESIDYTEFKKDYIPSEYRLQQFILYFPDYSVETYESGVKYALSINTWINNREVTLGTFIVSRNEAIACPTGPKVFLNNRYYEQIVINLVCPLDIIYNVDWNDFRRELCDKDDEKWTLKDDGSNLNVIFCPIEETEDGVWTKLPGYTEANTALSLFNKQTNLLGCKLVDNFQKITSTPTFSCSMDFNDEYEQSQEGFERYMYDVYSLLPENVRTDISLVIYKGEEIYKFVTHTYDGFRFEDKWTKGDVMFDNWIGYEKGMKVQVFCQIVSPNYEDDELEYLELRSNDIFLDMEHMKYLIGDNIINNVKLSLVDMNNYKIDVINKIITEKTKENDAPNEYKSNIIKPVFFKVQDGDNIVVHPAVTENISINLDAYKNKVDVFSIKIGDSVFVEIGRISSAVIFKIVGSNLSLSDGATGIYYILNDDGELVTTGKYTVSM